MALGSPFQYFPLSISPESIYGASFPAISLMRSSRSNTIHLPPLRVHVRLSISRGISGISHVHMLLLTIRMVPSRLTVFHTPQATGRLFLAVGIIYEQR